MIFVDANVFLRAMIDSRVPEAQRMSQVARDLFRRVDREEVEITTSDAVIAEVAFILTAKAHYQLSAGDAADRLATILRLPGIKLRDKRVILRALDIWADKPKLEFVDSLTAAHAQQAGMELASFDSDFDDIPGVTRWRPEQDGSNDH